jgi:hypothetical protein
MHWHEQRITTHRLEGQRGDYALAFRTAADRLVVQLEVDQAIPQQHIHPIVFLYHQYLHLEMLRLSRETWLILGEPAPIELGSNDLRGHWRLCHTVLYAVESDPPAAEFHRMKTLIDAFDDVASAPTSSTNDDERQFTAQQASRIQRIVSQAAEILSAIDEKVSALTRAKSLLRARFQQSRNPG